MILMVSAFATVFLLVFQQQNVIHRQYALAAVTSAFITITQFVVIKGVAGGDLLDMAYMIVGGMLGVLASMKCHEGMIRWFRRKNAGDAPPEGDATRIPAQLAPASASDFTQKPIHLGNNTTLETGS